MYTIKILTNDEFDKLPVSVTRGSYIKDSLGFADPVTNRAFVRHTAWPELNKYLIEHEFEHLVEEMKTDMDENGICHKKKGGFMSWIVPVVTKFLLPQLGPLAAMGIPGKVANETLINSISKEKNPLNRAINNEMAGGAGAAQGLASGDIIGAALGGLTNKWSLANDYTKNPDAKVGIGANTPFGTIGNPNASYSYQYTNPDNSLGTYSLGNIPGAIGQYGGTFSGQSAQTPSSMGPGAGGGNIGIMNTGLNQAGISLGAQNTLGDKVSSNQPGMSQAMGNMGGVMGGAGMNGLDNLFGNGTNLSF